MATRRLLPFSRNMPMARGSEDTDPFLQMRREMNRLFDDVFGGFGLPGVLGPALRQMPAAPKIDISETDNEIQVIAEMPGIDQNDVEVLLEDDRLIIRGEKKQKQEQEREDKDRNYHVRERVQGAFSRTLPLPFAPDPNQVKAEFKNGVMTITIPKPREDQKVSEGPPSTSVSGIKDVLLTENEIEAAAAFEAATTKLLKVAEETLAEVRQDSKETRVILDRLEARLAPHG